MGVDPDKCRRALERQRRDSRQVSLLDLIDPALLPPPNDFVAAVHAFLAALNRGSAALRNGDKAEGPTDGRG
jgi:hypothetical protein